MDFLCQDICCAAVSTQPGAESEIARSLYPHTKHHHSYGHWCLLVALHHEWHDIMLRPNWCAFTSFWLTVYWNYLWFCRRCHHHHHHHHHRRKFRSQTSDSMERWKADKRSRVRRKKIQLPKVRRKKIHTRKMLGKSWNAAFFQRICGSAGSKSRLAKAAGAEPCVQGRHEKFRAAVARSTFATQNVQNTPGTTFWSSAVKNWARRCGAKYICNSKCTKGHFSKFSCRKMARGCGAKRICNSKCTKHPSPGPLFEVQLLKNGTPLWRETHLQLKMHKTPHSRATFRSSAVKRWHAAVARSTFATQKYTKRTSPESLFEVQLSKNGTPLWREARLHLKMYKTHHSRTTFLSSAVEKWHAVVARSTFPSQNKMVKTRDALGILDLQISKNGTALWREVHFQSKCTKHQRCGALLEVRMSKRCPTDEIARSVVS